MSKQGSYTIREIREKLLGYKFDAVVRYSGVTRERLHALEDDQADPTVFEAFALGRTYGIDPDLLAEPPVTLMAGDAVQALALQTEFKDLGDEVRFRVVRAANAARDLKQLREMGGERALVGTLPRLVSDARDVQPFQQGRTHAEEIRNRTKQGSTPIPSMRDFLSNHFSAIAVLYAHLTSEGPDGLTFADRVRGPTIVINLDGKNTNPCVRRFSLAHELYHVLADWTRKQPLAQLSGYLTESGLAIEQRANGFATRLICPEAKIRRVKHDNYAEVIRTEIAPYGLHYSALRLYVDKVASVKLPVVSGPELTGIGTEAEWHHAEEPAGLQGFPLSDVPPERQTLVAQRAARLYVTGKISRRRFAEYLDVSLIQDVELVLDFFGLDRPTEGT